MFKIGCYFIVQPIFINLRDIWEDADRSIIFLRKLWLFYEQVRCLLVSVRWEILENKLNHWCHHMCILQKSPHFSLVGWFNIILLCSFIRIKTLERFLTSSVSIWLNLKTSELFLAVINLILGWPFHFSSNFKIESCSDESGHLYPLPDIFKIF